ncbi:MAG: type II secretion system F family protein [Armatimonadia bacterium]
MVIEYLIIGCSALAAIMLYLAARSREDVVVQRLDAAMRAGGLIMSGSSIDDSLSRSPYPRLIAPQLGRLRDAAAGIVPPQAMARIRARLERAGRTGPWASVCFILVKLGLLLLGIGAVLLTMHFYSGSRLIGALISTSLMLGALYAPEAGLNMLIRRRHAEIRRSLPDVIDLLAVSAEAGAGLDGSLGIVARRKPGALSDEFNRLLLEVRLGKGRDEAWADLAERVDLPELRAFVSALEQAEEMGVSIANTLRVQSDAIRIKHSLLIRQQAATLALRMLFPLVFCILPALFVVVLGPGLISIHRAMSATH